ncbi:toxin-antitoxin system protein [Metallumcola ferriviriculae]|uniref:Toxin-antitoxin system protein n=1 Tax=Metallumcola ferriviriculae TaxID=3039180 RepID=A0AAU0UPP9_9FIRM|nr:toxin-antitoxin system protein [Desulfitibacteraceae bacterium MK1]
MGTTTVRISRAALETLRQLAGRAGEPIQEILDKAIEEYRRKQFLEEANKAYAALKNDSQAWQDEVMERETWDSALKDGLEDEK